MLHNLDNLAENNLREYDSLSPVGCMGVAILFVCFSLREFNEMEACTDACKVEMMEKTISFLQYDHLLWTVDAKKTFTSTLN